jgi:secreted Zn-dependent insulinase-like peptidase
VQLNYCDIHFSQEKLTEMENDEFEKYKESLAVQRLEKPKKLSAECARYWSEITSQQYNFERGTCMETLPEFSRVAE